jgi:hypothetical protein
MATVQSSGSKRQPAKPTSKKPQPKTDGKAIVTVVKNGIERTFPRSIWDNLPADKEGYQEVVNKPEIPEQKPAPEPIPPIANAAVGEDTVKSDEKPVDQKPEDQPGANIPAPEQKPAEPASPTYDEAVKAYTDLFKEDPGQDLTIEEILGKITAKKQGGK